MSNFRARSVKIDHFSMIPRADIPRSTFNIETAHKSTFDAGLLIPIFVDEILPGDTFQLSMTAFCRMATPIFPILDNLYLDTHFFFVPALSGLTGKNLWGNRITQAIPYPFQFHK
jgi:Capsid protein (F protein)